MSAAQLVPLHRSLAGARGASLEWDRADVESRERLQRLQWERKSTQPWVRQWDIQNKMAKDEWQHMVKATWSRLFVERRLIPQFLTE
jgi:hypothetical protein